MSSVDQARLLLIEEIRTKQDSNNKNQFVIGVQLFVLRHISFSFFASQPKNPASFQVSARCKKRQAYILTYIQTKYIKLREKAMGFGDVCYELIRIIMFLLTKSSTQKNLKF